MTKKTVSRHEITLALSRDGRNYSLHMKPRTYRELSAAGVTHFRPEAVKSSTLVFSLQPVFGFVGKREGGAYTLQEKDGFGHVEFPTALVKRLVGVLGHGCRTQAVLFSTSVLQVRRPPQEEISRVLNAVMQAEASSAYRRSARIAQSELPLVN